MHGTTPPSSAAPSRLGAWVYAWGPTLWAAAVLLAALYFFLLSGEIRYSPRPGRLGPSFWPRAILIMLMITAAVDCLIEARKASGRYRAFTAGLSTGDAPPRAPWLMALGLAAVLLYVNLATVVGFPVANFVFLLAFMMLGGFTRPITALLISGIGTVTLILLFVRIVYVSLPLGTGPFQNLTLLLYSLLGIV